MEHLNVSSEGVRLLPFARSRVAALRASGVQYATQNFTVEGVAVGIKVAGDHAYITISGSKAQFLVSPSNSDPRKNHRMFVNGDKVKASIDEFSVGRSIDWAGPGGAKMSYSTGNPLRYRLDRSSYGSGVAGICVDGQLVSTDGIPVIGGAIVGVGVEGEAPTYVIASISTATNPRDTLTIHARIDGEWKAIGIYNLPYDLKIETDAQNRGPTEGTYSYVTNQAFVSGNLEEGGHENHAVFPGEAGLAARRFCDAGLADPVFFSASGRKFSTVVTATEVSWGRQDGSFVEAPYLNQPIPGEASKNLGQATRALRGTISGSGASMTASFSLGEELDKGGTRKSVYSVNSVAIGVVIRDPPNSPVSQISSVITTFYIDDDSGASACVALDYDKDTEIDVRVRQRTRRLSVGTRVDTYPGYDEQNYQAGGNATYTYLRECTISVAGSEICSSVVSADNLTENPRRLVIHAIDGRSRFVAASEYSFPLGFLARKVDVVFRAYQFGRVIYSRQLLTGGWAPDLGEPKSIFINYERPTREMSSNLMPLFTTDAGTYVRDGSTGVFSISPEELDYIGVLSSMAFAAGPGAAVLNTRSINLVISDGVVRELPTDVFGSAGIENFNLAPMSVITGEKVSV